MNLLYYGDNLDVLRRHVKDETVDLVYLDPPFKSNQDYNILFAEKDGTRAAAQFKAFGDTWEWNQATAAAYEEIVEGGGKVSDVMQAFRHFLGTNDMLAYLTMMAPRLVELRRVLKPHGSLFLHCDPTASHYLKLLMDAIFGPANFRNEIIWRRTRAHNDRKLTRYGAVHDTLLFFSKTENRIFNRIHTERNANSPKTHDLYRHTDGVLYRKGDCRAPGNRGPRYQWNGHERHWRFTEAEAKRLEGEGRIVYSKTGMPRVLRPVDLTKGATLQDVWTDVDPPNSGSAETLGYPTQKPEALLDRIIKGSSNEHDVVLDPFCGCGTAVSVAQKLSRNWIGIDITPLAVGLVKSRLRDAFGDQVAQTYRVMGEPVSVPDASELAREDPYQFQWWALGLVGARRSEQVKGSDRGIDGVLYFHDDNNGRTKRIVLSVKSGHVSVRDVRDLRGVIEREKAELGVLISLRSPTRAMLTEAASADFYKSPWRNHPRLQILTIAALLQGARIDYPPTLNVTHKQARRAATPLPEQFELAPTRAPEPQKAFSSRKPKRRRVG